jgi:hypothetical protein
MTRIIILKSRITLSPAVVRDLIFTDLLEVSQVFWVGEEPGLFI